MDSATVRALLLDGSLALRADAAVWPYVVPWMPRIPAVEPGAGQARAWIRVEAGAPAFAPPSASPILEVAGVRGWRGPSGQVLLCEAEGRLSAVADPAAGRAAVRLDARGETPAALHVELLAGFTLASALLLGRLGRTLLHAGAIVAPGGRAWLLVGGTFSGKSTTCVNLIRAGWDYVADDHVVLRRAGEGVEVEGWPRRFNLDHGYALGVSQGVRGRVDPEAFGPGRWVRAAPLGGLLFPRVQAELPTALEPMNAADALTGLLLQSPWLLADPETAVDVLALLERTARLPAFRLRLGADSYTNRARLTGVLRPAVGDGGSPSAGEGWRHSA